MDTEIITIYCLCDDFLKAMNHVEDRQRRLIEMCIRDSWYTAAPWRLC